MHIADSWPSLGQCPSLVKDYSIHSCGTLKGVCSLSSKGKASNIVAFTNTWELILLKPMHAVTTVTQTLVHHIPAALSDRRNVSLWLRKHYIVHYHCILP